MERLFCSFPFPIGWNVDVGAGYTHRDQVCVEDSKPQVAGARVPITVGCPSSPDWFWLPNTTPTLGEFLEGLPQDSAYEYAHGQD